MEISAIDAYKITEIARKPIDAWDKLFDRIRETAEKGYSALIFDEEKEKVRFKEHRKEVKNKLEELGYRVSHARVRDDDDYYGETYHICYTIAWEL